MARGRKKLSEIREEVKLPEGLIYKLPPKPRPQLIQGYGLDKEEQYWKRTPLPDRYPELQLIEKEEQQRQKNSNYQHPELLAFRKQEWTRRIHGHWFYNEGVPTYITGFYYWLLNWVQPTNNGEYPTYKEVDRIRTYYYDLCLNDDKCSGWVEFGPRGYGKTMFVLAFMLELMTRRQRVPSAAIQSKDDDTAAVVFTEQMVPMYKSLPDFFKPINDSGSNPKYSLSFKAPNVRGKRANKVVDDSLGNVIKFYPASEKKLDGMNCAIIYNDEFGKQGDGPKINVYERAMVNRNCVWRDARNPPKVGLLVMSSTVEEMDDDKEYAKKLWDESDPQKLDKNGRTKTWLYRLFVPATDTQAQFIDKYGKISKQKALNYLMNEREANADDPHALASLMRKKPIEVSDMWINANKESLFDIAILNSRNNEIISGQARQPVRGNLVWANGKDTTVRWVPTPSGSFMISQLPSLDKMNQVVQSGYTTDMNGNRIPMYKPLNPIYYRAGCDPIDHVTKGDGRRSKMAALIFRREDTSQKPLETYEEGYKAGRQELVTNRFVCMYLNRPTVLHNGYEDILKMCRFFGTKILVENNKPNIINYFKSRGYEHYLQKATSEIIGKGYQRTKVLDDGAPGTELRREEFMGLLNMYVGQYGHLIDFPELIDELINYNHKNKTKFDLIVAAGYALLHNKETLRMNHELPQLSNFLF